VSVPFLAALLTVTTASASSDLPADVGKQAKGAKKVVVATVTDVDSEFGENDYGDRLIYSRVTLRVDETMKGNSAAEVVVSVEGGTVGELTLTVSDMPRMERGQRAVLFLDESEKNGNVPHGRGRGVLKLDDDDRVPGTSLSLEDIRAAVKAAKNEGGK
jgi:hypothetical protein